MDESRPLCVAAYCLPVGWIVALAAARIMGENGQLVTFHLRQGLGFNLTILLCYILLDRLVDIWWLSQIAHLALVLAGALGIYAALRARRIAQPLLGRLWHHLFRFIR